ncbi:dTDP-4-dehydrorhamnose 3,5-epimerase [Sneathiella marina]|uniref:dTDP-4-dehydrorhamnose 3,5-epimerase n=1 Tax=Sneathiella marina TaxID=2950108 RepID=A0ABY4W6R4_9PROT|nr:dTDP-4-dehydrorhamnose 3,5-epimerase [Sneathiella marina]USG60341.1 dTDP-4-dehydrorhamnose 3,5-epimerase [Sneathiella marina]
MKFTATEISDVFIVDMDRHEDDRGYFARTFCEQEFAEQGISFTPVQSNISHNKQAFTLRGMHYHAPPYEETKLVRCSAGRLFDVAVDLRPHSPSFKKWVAVELSPENGRGLHIPAGCAHGFLTLEDNSDVFYQMGPAFTPGHDRGFRWDDPEIAIKWPADPLVISHKDQLLDNFS